ncbi:MAG: hypothetical protein LBU19_08930 [Treponema sp.]|jgi:hypothetical protein|nr:hypothetical protein [Treponema sp.]
MCFYIKKWYLLFMLVYVTVLPAGGIFALDLTVLGGAGNTAFEDNRLSPLGDEGLRFTPRLYSQGSLLLEGNYSRVVGFRTGFERDPILKDRVIADIVFRGSFLKFELGPFVGILNSPEKPVKPGISAALRLEFPGVIFGSVQAASALGTALSIPGDYAQEKGTIAFGFWVPHVLCIFSINTKGFSRLGDQRILIRDEQIRYQFTGNVFSWSVPYGARLDLGYQQLKRSYTSLAGDTKTDKLNSLYIGAEIVFTLRSVLRLFLGGEMPVYSWGTKPLTGPERRTRLFQVHGGFTWTLPARSRRQAAGSFYP